MTRFYSLAIMIAGWALAAALVQSRLLPGPLTVGTTMLADLRSGELPFHMACTLGRVISSFAIAMVLGIFAGYAMGRSKTADRYADPWLTVLLNMPALVTIIFAYIWIGLNEAAAIVAVALNKLPNAVVTLREGARTLDVGLDEMAAVFGFSPWKRWRHVVLPQLAPFFAAATRSGLSLVWKIVLVVELLGRPNGVGFEIGTAFQLFDVATLLAYALPFTAIMLAIETLLVQPFERHAARWRPRPA